MKFCPQCGTTFEPEGRFCQECGFDKQSIEPQAEIQEELSAELVTDQNTGSENQAPPVCPKCLAPLPEEDRFCAECGFDRQLTETLAPPPLVVAEDTTPPASAEEPVKPDNLCPECASAMAEEDRFCPKCGFDIKTLQQPEEVAELPQVVLPPAEKLQKAVEIPVISEDPVAEVSGMFCPSCGVSMQPGDVFCQECGYKHAEPEAKAEPSAIPAAPPPAPPVVPPVAQATPPPAVPPPPPVTPKAQVSAPTAATGKKRKKVLVVALLGLLALGVLGAGGWYAYKQFFSGNEKVLTETVVAEVQTPEPEVTEVLQEPEAVVEEEPPAAVVQEKPAPPKTTTPPKTKPKKQAEPSVAEPPKEEPAKKAEGITAVMNTKTTAKSSKTIYNNFNTNEVKSGPVFPNKIRFDKPTIVTRIITFHHNDGNGAPAGTIMLEGKKKDTGGPWQARNAPGSDGNVNGKWIVEPNALMEPGTYKVVVSDEKSWSFNSQSGRKGFVIVEGYEPD